MCMCIELAIPDLKQKNAHASFPVGMVFSLVQRLEKLKKLIRFLFAEGFEVRIMGVQVTDKPAFAKCVWSILDTKKT